MSTGGIALICGTIIILFSEITYSKCKGKPISVIGKYKDIYGAII